MNYGNAGAYLQNTQTF